MKTTVRRCASLITLLTLLSAMLAPTAAFAADWTVDRLILVFHDGSSYDTADDDGAALTPLSGANFRLWDDAANELHVSCSDDLTVNPGTVVALNGDTLTITDYYIDAINPGGNDTPPCGNPDLLEEPELCPEGTVNAGIPVDEVDDCDPEEEPELCPEGTVNAGTPVDEVEDCDDPVVVEDLVCPEDSDFPGTVVDDLDDCIETAVLPVVIETEDDDDDDTEVLGVSQDRRELARTGADSPQSLLLFGLLLVGLGTEVLRRTRTA